MGARAVAVVLAAVVVALAGPASGQQQAPLFGAIAYAPKTRAIGVAADNVSQAEAESVALQNCRSISTDDPADCRNIMWVRSACAALAVGTDGGWGTSWGVDRATAERKAIDVCAKNSSSCEVVRRVCALRGN
jgi:serine/threonine-protein kinase